MDGIYKDEHGFWRDGRERKIHKWKRCPKCKSDLISEEFDAEGTWDDEIVAAYRCGPNEDHDQFTRCFFGRDIIRCEECGEIREYGPRHYWNPDTNRFDQPDILLPEIGEKLFAAQERRAQIKAGQRVLFR